MPATWQRVAKTVEGWERAGLLVTVASSQSGSGRCAVRCRRRGRRTSARAVRPASRRPRDRTLRRRGDAALSVRRRACRARPDSGAGAAAIPDRLDRPAAGRVPAARARKRDVRRGVDESKGSARRRSRRCLHRDHDRSATRSTLILRQRPLACRFPCGRSPSAAPPSDALRWGNALRKFGIAQGAIDRLVCPIGVDRRSATRPRPPPRHRSRRGC